MKGTLKLVGILVILLALVVPVSARSAGVPADRAIDGIPASSIAAGVLVDWYENWDAYPTGQNMHGVGGWKGWGNDPTWTAYTTDVQFISFPNSIDINDTSDLVHEYAIDAGVWTYTAWQYIPANLVGTTYFILLNQYDDAGLTWNWSVQVEFDSVTDLVINDGGAGGTLPIIYDTWVEIAVVIDLDNDWQEFYYGGNLLFAGSWSEGMSGGGITSIGAVDLFANGASPVYYDDLSLVETVGENTMHVGGIEGYFNLDPEGRPRLVMRVMVVDQFGGALGDVQVDASLWVPDRGPIERTRYTKPTGLARFRWGSTASGTWTLCVDDLTLEGYLYVPGDNVVTCMDWYY